ncbi:MAG: DUF1349 domain-containing protein [Isosphaeraceae bacterium]|nr:DUF1349 domain-containing protein [Isosphaeraceae bacterium]
MANSIACPSCNEPFGLPASFTGGRATCPNPKCGKTFYAPAPESPQPATGVCAARGRTFPVRPARVSHIPPNFYASPAFVAGGAVVVLLYGMVLFGVLSSERRDADVAYDEPRPLPALVFHEASPIVHRTDVPPVSLSSALEKSVQKEPTPKPADLPQPQPIEKAASKPADQPGLTPLPPSNNAGSAPSASPVPQPKAAPPADVPKPRPKPAPRSTPTAVAANVTATKPVEPSAAVSVEGPTFNGLSAWIDPERAVKSRRDADAIIVAIPAGIHILSPELKHKDAPMSLAEVTGDFEMQVRVAGGIRPGSNPLPDVPVPIAFQGAGLLLWQDADNYLRLERAAMSGPNQPLTQKVVVEVCREGRPGGYVYKDTSDRPVYLRATRRGDDLECAYSPDGKTWITIKKSGIALFPDKLRVGIGASNLSPKTFSPRFEDFTLERPGGKNGSR